MPEIHSAGENALIVYLGREASPDTAALVQAAGTAIETVLGHDLVDLVPSYASILVIYDPFTTDHLSVGHRLREALDGLSASNHSQGRTVVLPVYYAAEAGADLEPLAEKAGLSVDLGGSRHSRKD